MPAAESLLFESDHATPEILRAPYSATQCFEQTSLQRSHNNALPLLCVTYDKFTQLAEPPEPRRLLDKLPRVPR